MYQASKIKRLAIAGVIGALYAALTISLAPISYGPVQFRLSEALCILPFFFPMAAPGLFVGCAVANLLSAYGIIDVVFGSLATLLAAMCTMQLGRINRESVAVKALACAPPVIFNALIIGAVIAWAETGGGGAFWADFAVIGLQVGFGELVVLYAIGLPLMIFLPSMPFFKSLSAQYHSL